MAVVPMKRLELFALRRDRKAILELLQRRGVVEVESTQASGEVFRQADTSQAQQELETQARLLEQAVELLDHTVPVKKGMLSFLAGRKPVTWEEYQRQGQEAPALLEQAREILRLGKQVTDSEAQAQRLEAQLETLKPWMALDLPLDAKGTGSTRVFLGSFPQALEEGALKAQLAQRLPQVSGIEAEVLSCQAQQTCVFLVCLRQDAAQVEEALRSMGFTYPAVTSPLPPSQQAKALEEEMWQSPHTFCLAGYLPAEDAPGLVGELESRFTLLAEVTQPGPQEDPPVKLKNNFFTEPVEGVVEGYSLPGRHEVDPSAVMAFFYYVLFGMMLSDAAYGILTVVGSAFALRKFPDMELKMRKTLRMFLFCGISTTVWGVLFGSYFGDAIPVIAQTFFHTEIRTTPCGC